MKQIHSLDKQFETYNGTAPLSVVHGYRKSRDLGLDTMILADLDLYPQSVPAIIESLRKHGIEQVAFISRGTDTLELLRAFSETGATFVGDLVYTGIEDRRGNCAPGYIVTVN